LTSAAFLIDDHSNTSKLINSHTSDWIEVMFLDKEERASLTFKHVRRGKPDRSFTGKVVKSTPDYKLVKPDRFLFLQKVTFAPGNGFQEHIDFYKHVDNELKKKYGKTRCDMDVHEIATFFTMGDQDMVILWDAPDSDTYYRVVAAGVNPGDSYGNSSTSAVFVCGHHTKG